jgi:hypothetical protein
MVVSALVTVFDTDMYAANIKFVGRNTVMLAIRIRTPHRPGQSEGFRRKIQASPDPFCLRNGEHIKEFETAPEAPT